MQHELEISHENGVGIITLNRPKAINALTPDMIGGIHNQLLEWADDRSISFVLFEGNGERGFCAGGDVRWTRDKILSGDQEGAFEFFALEYEMNLLIGTYAKPIVALTHGVVMGGGLGIAGHAKYRITTENSRFAMPEAAIGFFCDVGVRSILAKTSRQRALMFMLSGSLVSAIDAVVLGLSDIVILENALSPVRAALISLGHAKEIDKEITNLCGRFGIGYGFANFCNLADQYTRIFEKRDIQSLYAALEVEVSKGSELADVAKTILSRCPTSNLVHFLGFDAARENSDIAKILEVDLALAHILAVRDDFVEGVRAVLVDKDHSAKWQPNKIGEVDGATIERAFSAK